jgi:DNA-binding CsgD family transcriptional regulator
MDRVLRARRQPQAVGIAAFFSAERARREGHWDRAAALLEESIGLAAASGMTDVVGLARLACLRAYRGEEASVPGLVESAQDRLDVWSPWSASWLIQAQGALALTRGRPEEAVGILAPVRRYPFVGRGARDAVAACLVDLVESLALTGDRTSAAGAARDLATRLDGIVDPLGLALVARSRALVARDADEADALLAAALREHDRTLEVFERARTLLVRGESLRRTRRPRQAREPLAAALSEFERLRTPDWAQRALRELAASGERVDPRTDGRPVQLTAQEARVALAVAEGLTNTEVAQQLFLSVKTVEFHLSRVYRKLDVRSRGGLARALALHGY